uniref:HDAg domain-containing protein n=1 Tax=Parastrongyloides trichosuri TaxID=131310 RepID=A0A0N4ZSZ7_PARTI
MNDSFHPSTNEQDICKLLNTKLGDFSELWSSRQTAAFLDRQYIEYLSINYRSLSTQIKLKVLLALPQLVKRYPDINKELYIKIIEAANDDDDEWIELLGQMYKNFPNTQCLNDLSVNEFFNNCSEELNKVIEERDNQKKLNLIPPSACLMTKNSVKNIFHFNVSVPTEHFVLKKQPKSYKLKAEVKKMHSMTKNSINLSNVKLQSMPLQSRSMARIPNTSIPMTKIPREDLSKKCGGFSKEIKKSNRPPLKRGRTIQMVEVQDTQMGEMMAKKLQRKAELEQKRREKIEKQLGKQQLTTEESSNL